MEVSASMTHSAIRRKSKTESKQSTEPLPSEEYLPEQSLEPDGDLQRYKTANGIPIQFHLDDRQFLTAKTGAKREHLDLHLRLLELQLLRGFDQLLCLDGLQGVEHLPHQIETVRKVLRRFRGRVLLADEVGLGKTIEACLLLREYILRGQVRRVLILVPNPLVSQWQDELSSKFRLDFIVPPRTSTSDRQEFWDSHDRVLVSTSFAKTGKRPEAITAANWDLVIVDEAHHCKNRATKIWQLINSLKRRNMFLLTATPVQNNLTELYSLLTLLEPGHLKTEADFKRQFVTRGNPRDPRNREKLRGLLGEVMIRNTRSLVQINLPPRYAQTIIARPNGDERELYRLVHEFLRRVKGVAEVAADKAIESDKDIVSDKDMRADKLDEGVDCTSSLTVDIQSPRTVSRMKLQSILHALGSHPAALVAALESLSEVDPAASDIRQLALAIKRSAKDLKLLELLKQSEGHKVLVFVHSLRTLQRLQYLLEESHIAFSTFSGQQSAQEKDAAVESLRTTVPVMLCTDSGGEGRNLQFADTLINYDLPWNPMRIEQRIGRVHRYGQTQDVYIFNLCTEESLESKILSLLNDKIRMFELVVGEIGSILGNLDEGEDFESLVLKMWVQATDDSQLDKSFASLGDMLIGAQEEYLKARDLDEALFGDDYE